MANVKPLKLDSNKTKQFLSTDTIPTNNLGTGTANSTTYLRGDQTWATVTSGGGSTKQVEIDLGTARYNRGGKVNVIDASVTTSSNIITSKVVKAASNGREAEEMVVENYFVAAKANNGSIDFYIQSTQGTISGKFVINYTY